MVNGKLTAVGLVLLLLGLWTTNALSMLGINIFSSLPSLTLPQLIPSIPTSWIILLLGAGVTIWGLQRPY